MIHIRHITSKSCIMHSELFLVFSSVPVSAGSTAVSDRDFSDVLDNFCRSIENLRKLLMSEESVSLYYNARDVDNILIQAKRKSDYPYVRETLIQELLLDFGSECTAYQSSVFIHGQICVHPVEKAAALSAIGTREHYPLLVYLVKDDMVLCRNKCSELEYFMHDVSCEPSVDTKTTAKLGVCIYDLTCIMYHLARFRFPKRIFEHNKKHPNTPKGKRKSKKQDPISNLMCTLDRAQELLNIAIGNSCKRMWAYDGEKQCVIEFQRHLEHKWHGYHIDQDKWNGRQMQEKLPNDFYDLMKRFSKIEISSLLLK